MSITFSLAYQPTGHPLADAIAWANERVMVNMSNTNAALVIERLGLEFDYSGSISADDLLGRALVGNIGRDDTGTATHVDAAAGRATIVECGLPDGYFDSRLGALAELAEAAQAFGVPVTWC